jgi:hypothetical protein
VSDWDASTNGWLSHFWPIRPSARTVDSQSTKDGAAPSWATNLMLL